MQQIGSPDVLCLQELRIRAQDSADIARLQAALPGYRCHFSLARDARNVTFRGGRMYGVATFVRGRWRAEVPIWDLEGRVVAVRKTGLAVVNIYAVNGTSKPYYNEQGEVSGDRHALKRRFQAQVVNLGYELRREGSVILAGDWNVSRTALDTYPRLRAEEPHARDCDQPLRLARRCSLSRTIPVRSATGRISKGPTRAPGCLDINSTA